MAEHKEFQYIIKGVQEQIARFEKALDKSAESQKESQEETRRNLERFEEKRERQFKELKDSFASKEELENLRIEVKPMMSLGNKLVGAVLVGVVLAVLSTVIIRVT